MKISLTMPSKDRPFRFLQNITKWMKDSRTDNVQYIFIFDKQQIPVYQKMIAKLPKKQRVRVIANQGKVIGCHGLVNRLARQSTGDVIVTSADDMWSCQGWDQKILSHFPTPDTMKSLVVNDGYQNVSQAKMMVLPIMSRKLIEKIGYIFYQGYKHLWADTDILMICQKMGVVQYDGSIYIQHRHPSLGKREPDKLYFSISTNMDFYYQGQKLLNERIRRNFDLEFLK